MILDRSDWRNDNVPQSTCSRECTDGQIKKISKDISSCCFDCMTCPEGTFENTTECISCPVGEWSTEGSKTCQPPTIYFLTWKNYYVIALLIFMMIIMIHILAVTFIFLRNRCTPVVSASGGFTCFLTLLGLICMNVSIFFYIGEPSGLVCHVQQSLMSIGFTIFIGPILVKSMQLLFCPFPSHSGLQWIFTSGRWIILLCTMLGEVSLCVFYIKSSLLLPENISSDYINSFEVVISCKYEPLLQFSLMLAYNCILILLSFICCFMAEKPAHQYNMARDITVAMLTLIMLWIIFIPTYVSVPETLKSIIQITFILGSTMEILASIFLPKCYIIMFKNELNNSEYFGLFIPNNQTEKE